MIDNIDNIRMSKQVIYTPNAPKPIGSYSQAVRTGNMVFISGQIPINPETNELDNNSIVDEVVRVFTNLRAICEQVGASLSNIVKLNLYLTDLSNFNIVNEVMTEYFTEPYPARAAVEVSALPKGVSFEAEAIVVLEN